MKDRIIQSIDVYAFNQRMRNSDNFLLLDVRTEEEVAICRLPRSVAVPVGAIPSCLEQLPSGIDIVVYCHHGVRSNAVVHYLTSVGFDLNRLFNLEGGIDAFAKYIDPSLPRYK